MKSNSKINDRYPNTGTKRKIFAKNLIIINNNNNLIIANNQIKVDKNLVPWHSTVVEARASIVNNWRSG